MDKLITFRQQADTLIDSEFDSFVTILLATLGRRETLTRALFHLFHAQLNNTDTVPVQTAIESIAAIISARDEGEDLDDVKGIDRSQQTSKRTTKFADLPSMIIGVVGSYLKFKSYNSFMISSRSNYIGCTTPRTLRMIDGDVWKLNRTIHRSIVDRQYLKMTLYRHVIHFGINVNVFMKMESLHDKMWFPRTTSLSLYHSNQNTMRRFLSTNTWDLTRIETLKFHFYRIKRTRDSNLDDLMQSYGDVLCEMFLAFPNLRFFGIGNMDIYTFSDRTLSA